jgi:anti-sigma-K factor RskA
MRQPDRELTERLAAEYVLGTLRGRARDRFERWMKERPDLRATVRRWEDRLLGLTADTARIAPPPSAWTRIEVRLGLRLRASAPAARPARRTRGLAAAAALAAVAVALTVTRLAQPPAPQWQSTVLLVARGSTSTAWRVEVSVAGDRLRLQAERPLALTPDRAYELWALPASGSAPVSLGLLPRTGEALRRLTLPQRLALAGAGQLAVSLEPAGGSPTGAPTGDVVIVAPVVRTPT